ncbi:MAG: hypothetical protein HC769_35230 [Cyanobacteria bacterium CRU_2_1]|nr:hypothetical protein [Cyanobacteria bacterium CRU_2_1]
MVAVASGQSRRGYRTAIAADSRLEPRNPGGWRGAIGSIVTEAHRDTAPQSIAPTTVPSFDPNQPENIVEQRST